MSAAQVIDIRPLQRAKDCPTGSADRVIDQVGSACQQWGFFQVINHGVATDLLDRFKNQTRAFFDAPVGVKNAISRRPANPRGFWDYELTKRQRDWREGFDFGGDGNFEVDGENQWPHCDALPDFRATMTEYFDAVSDLAAVLASCMARHLGLDVGYFDAMCGSSQSSFIRLNHYPRCPHPGDNLGVGPHTDASLVTVLLQDGVDGLQFESNGEWLSIPPVEGAYVVNVGDLMRVFSNGEFCSPNHRAIVRATTERFSAPFFLNPSYDTLCAPAAELLGKGRPAMYRPFRWGEFRAARYAGNIADLGVEVQVSNYCVDQPKLMVYGNSAQTV